MTIKHAFTSSRPDPVDSLLVKPSDWNADHVVDEIICSGHSAMGKGGLIDRGAYFYSGDPVKSVLNIFETFSGDITSYTGFLGGLFILTEADQGGNSPSNMLFGADIEAMTNVANNKSIGGICGGNFSGHHFGSGLLTELIGVEAAARNGGPGSVSKAVGIDAYVSNYGGGSITNSYGFYFPAVYNKNSIITNNYGVRIDDQSYYNNLNGGTITNNYGIYIGDQSGLGSSSWNIYSAGVSSKNYFQGNVGIGTVSPSVALEVGYPGQLLARANVRIGGFLGVDTYAYNTIGNNTTHDMRFGAYNSGVSPYAYYGIIQTPQNKAIIIVNEAQGMIAAFGADGAAQTQSVFFGNVGIGTVSPAQKLEIMGAGIQTIRLSHSTEPTRYTDISGAGGYGDCVIDHHGDIGWGSKLFFKYNGATQAVIDESGNVGIGTVSPGSKLSVVGLPGATAGLGPGDIWVDAAAGNVLKIV